jgi:hypothetical protein
VNGPIRALLDEALAWRDACGRAYKVVHRVELAATRAVLRLGKFDRVTRRSLARLEGALGEGAAYAIGGWEALLQERALAVTLVKRGAGGEASLKRLRRVALEASTARVPVREHVAAADRAAVEETVHRALAALGEGAEPRVRVVEMPAEYHVRFEGLACVPDRALAACAGDASHVDFDGAALVAVVPKSAPDILF